MLKITTKWLQYDNRIEPVTDEKNYELRIKALRTSLRIKYSIVFLLALFIVLVISNTADNPTFVQQITFGSTLVSMILAVLAIFISGRRELKAEVLRDELDRAMQRLDMVSQKLEAMMDERESSLPSVDERKTSISSEEKEADQKSVEKTKTEPKKEPEEAPEVKMDTEPDEDGDDDLEDDDDLESLEKETVPDDLLDDLY
ncbi:MAG: hypothetical protein ACLU94_08110 [Catenibacillus sp.]